MKRGAACATVALAAWLQAGSAEATPSRWALARSPEAYAEQQAIDEAERGFVDSALTRIHKRELEPFSDPDAPIRRGLLALEQVDAAHSQSWYAKLLWGRSLQALSRWPEVVALWEELLADSRLPTAFRSDVLAEVAIAYARVNRQEHEIAAYDAAIALEEGGASAHLLPLDQPSGGRETMLANQAEGFMVLGDISRAISGYRAALDAMDSNTSRFVYSPTTLWSLGVAQDRAGDLGAALDTIALARSYDPEDKRISGPTWFFVPSYEEHYYWALGHLQTARRVSDQDEQLAAYERSVLAWNTYLASAPATDLYAAMARARLQQVSREYNALRKRAMTPTPINPHEPAQPR